MVMDTKRLVGKLGIRGDHWKAFNRSLKVTALMLAAFLGGCGGAGLQPKGFGQSPLPGASQVGMASTVQTDWKCPEPGSFNIHPHNRTTVGDGSFAACRGASDSSKVKISGFTSSQTLCVYGMITTPGSTSLSLGDTRRCYQVGSGSVVIQFATSQINYLYIVDARMTNAFESCLTGTTDCPSYSEGSLY